MSAGRQAITVNKDWCTPQKYVDAVKRVWGGKIDLDPCSSIYSVVNAETEFLLPEKDGLLEEWDYPTIYVNPPYGNDKERGTAIRDWFKKISVTYKKFNNEIIALVPVATNTSHWKKYVYPIAGAICFLYDTRLKFIIGGTDDNKGAPMSCCVIYYGNNPTSFMKEFSSFGAALTFNGILFPAPIIEHEYEQIDFYNII
ncbi:MAG: phage N-6-adenine-methyltransferase [Oscillospiraceae bacterium]|nr:phage N-6-adenine-methyltransferase [Oscillospiraceae bacterium]